MICNAFHLTLLASLLPFAAFARTFNVSPLPVSPYVDYCADSHLQCFGDIPKRSLKR
jgi:hypothetical protein